MVRTKKFLSVLLTIVMLLQTLVIPNFAADVSGFVDFPTNSWSTAAMTAAVDNGLLKGTSDTTIEPSKNLTRAEFAAIITRAFGATKVADISHFADVDASDWYYNSVAMAVQMGVMNGTSDTTFSPAAYMKREDVILSLARVLFVDGDDTTVLDQFSDKGVIDYWAYKAIAGMVAEGYVNGYNDGTIRPLNYITREELAQLFHNIFKTYVSVKGTYDYIPGNGSVVIRTPDVTLRNMTINGDLVMAEGIGEGNLTLINVTVLGKIIARGGEDTVYFKNVEAEGNVIINDPNGVVNFHNYRDEKPFVDNLVENTPATFLERGGTVVGGGGGISGGSGGGGGSATYSLYFYESLEDLNEGKDPIKQVTGKKGSYVVLSSNVPDDEQMEKDGFKFMGWSKKNSVEGKKKDYFVSKDIGKVSGKWYAVYDPIAAPTVTFKWTINGGDSGEIVFEDVLPDYVITEDDLDAFPNDDEMEKFGYEFEGWQNEYSDDIYKKADFIDKTIYEIAGDNEEVTFEPVYEALEFYFDFKDENGDDIELVGVEAGTALEENNIPTPELDESKKLIGWTTVEGETVVEYTNEILTGKNVEEFEDELFFGDSTSEERTVKLYAVLADKEAINVVFVGEGTVTKYDPDAELEDSEVPEDPEKENHNFKGWSQDPNAEEGEDRDYFLGKPVSELEGTWYPIFEEVYTITFVTPDDEVVVTKTEGEALEESEIPEIEVDESEEFKGWTLTEGSTNVDFTDDDLTADVVENVFEELEVKLYPVVVEKDAYTVIFDGEGSVTKYDPNAMLEESEVPEDPEKENHNFKGWSKDSEATEGEDRDYFLDNPISALVGTWYPIFEAIEEPDVYTITFALTGVDTVVTKTEGEALEESEIPEIEVDESEEFKGWTLTEGSTNVDFTDDELTADAVESVFDELEVKLYPVVVEKDAYTVIFDGEGSVTKYDPNAMLEESEVPEDPEKENHNFKGWSKDPNAEEGEDRDYFLGKPVSELAGTWYPIFEAIEEPDVYTITFALTGVDTVVTKTEGETLEESEIPEIEVDESKEFLGWTLTEGSTNVDFTDDDLTADAVENVFDELKVILYPVVVEKDAYTVIFDGEGTVTKYDPDAELEDSEVPEDPEKENHTFKGWSKDANAEEGEDRDYFIGKPISEVVGTWYPIFEAHEYTVIFDGEGSVTKYDPNAMLEDSEVPEDPEKENYTFKGWSQDSEATEGEDRDYFLDNPISALVGTWYPIFEAVEGVDEYTIVFVTPGRDKTVKKLENEKIAANEIPEIPVDESKEFLGWTLTEGSTDVDFTDDDLTADVVEKLFGGSTEVVLYYVIADKECYSVKFVLPDEDLEDIYVSSYDPDYMLDESEVPEDLSKYDHTFMGWSKDSDAEDGKDRDYFLNNPISVVAGTWYPIFKENLDEYTITFVTSGGRTDVTKTEREAIAEDEIPEVTAPDNYTFEGWSTTEGADEPEYTNDDLTADVVENVFSDFEVTLYPVFKLALVTYKVEFYVEGTVISTVEEPHDYVLDESDVYDAVHPEKPEDYKFVGWTTDEEGNGQVYTSDDLRISIQNLEKAYYAKFEKVTENYFVFFKYTTGDKALETVEETLSASEDYVLTSSDVYDVDYFEEPYEKYVFLGWTTTVGGTDYIASEELAGKSIKEIEGTYYAQFETLLVLNFYDLATSEDPVNEEPIYVHAGDSAVYPDYELFYELGYEKSYDKDYIADENYHEDTLHTDRYDEPYKHGHKLNYEWYYKNENGDFVRYDDSTVIETDLDVYSKIRKIDILIEIPKSIVDIDEILTFNVPYEDDSRFLDLVRDALFFNKDQVVTKINETGIEKKLYDKLSGFGERFFDGSGIFNEEYEFNNTDFLIKFSTLMGDAQFKAFLDSFYDGEEATKSLEEVLYDHIMNHKTADTAEHLKNLIDALIEDHPDVAEELMYDLAHDIAKHEVTYIEDFFVKYAKARVDENNTADLEEMICDMLAEYKETNKDEFVGFVTEAIIKALSNNDPNNDTGKVKSLVEQYIRNEIVSGKFDAEIYDYIMGMDDDEFVSAAKQVIKVDPSIIEEDIEIKIIDDDAFVLSAVDEIFNIDSDTVRAELRSYINEYNLADDYIRNNPDKIVDYIPDANWPGVGGYGSLSRDEKIQVLKSYISSNSDAIATLKGYVSDSDLDNVFREYLNNNTDTVKEQLKTKVLSEDKLRNDFAEFSTGLITNPDYVDFLDFAIDEYLNDIKTNTDKQSYLANEAIERLKDIKINSLAFVEEAVQKVIKDVIADISANKHNSNYIGNIEAYADSIKDFSDIVEAVLYSGDTFRRDVIVSLFEDLYVIDSDHTIIIDAILTVVDKMIEDKSVDVMILETVIDYVKTSDNGHELTMDIIDDLMVLGDELLEYAKEYLGYTEDSDGRLGATLKFRKEVTENDEFEVTVANDFIMEMVKNKVESMTFDSFLDEFVTSRVPESLLNRLPIEILENIYNDSYNSYLTDLQEARDAVKNGATGCYVGSGFTLNFNLITDVIEPLMTYVRDSHTKAVDKAVASDNRVAELVEKYYVENPYATDNGEGYRGFVNGYVVPELYFEDADGDGFYSVKALSDIYEHVLMPLSVETTDALLWYTDNISFSKIEKVLMDPENKEIALHFVNHINALMADYAKNGLPEDISEYYYDLLSDEVIADAVEKVEKLDNKGSFDMMYFVETKLHSQLAEMLYMQFLNRLGVPTEMLLSKYVGSPVHNDYTEAEYDNYVEQLGEIWADTYSADDGLDNLFRIAGDDDAANIAIKGFSATVIRSLADAATDYISQ